MPLPALDEVRIVGLGVSPGVAMGRAHLAEGFFSEPTAVPIPAENADAEWHRFQTAIEKTKRQLQGLLDRAATDAGAGHAGIFEAHLLMAEDPSLLKAVERGIREQHLQAEGVFYREMERYMQVVRRFDDDYLRERVIDLDDVMRRVLGNMGGPCDTCAPAFPHILLAHDLAPSQTLEMDRALVLGFATEVGSQTSHTAILARSLGIPAVVGLYDVHSHIRGGDDILLDGAEGVLIVRPRPDTVAAYQSRQRRRKRVDSQLVAIRQGDATTRDGHRVIISANIELAEEMPTVMDSGAEGVGLYRTEFLFMNRRDWPTEDEQAEDYAAVARQSGEHGVIIRTLDIGGDKLPSHSPDAPPTAPEGNPFLGFRGIRRSLQEPHIFKSQLRAILRASASVSAPASTQPNRPCGGAAKRQSAASASRTARCRAPSRRCTMRSLWRRSRPRFKQPARARSCSDGVLSVLSSLVSTMRPNSAGAAATKPTRQSGARILLKPLT